VNNGFRYVLHGDFVSSECMSSLYERFVKFFLSRSDCVLTSNFAKSTLCNIRVHIILAQLGQWEGCRSVCHGGRIQLLVSREVVPVFATVSQRDLCYSYRHTYGNADISVTLFRTLNGDLLILLATFWIGI
jgi:hypothetical protein